MRVAMRGDLSHVSPFHRRRSRSFLGVLCGFCLFGWVFLFGLCLFCFPRFRDQSSSLTKLNDRLSCHGAHGMGGKKDTIMAL